MRGLILAAVLVWAAPAAAGPGVLFDETAYIGASGGYFGNRFEVSTPLARPYYRLSASVRSSRYPAEFSGTAVEYAAALRRELYHVSIAGRVATRPPNAESAAYHLAYGEASLTFYGLSLGPEHPEFSAQIWESSGPAPAPESLDRTWVTRMRARYTTTNHHVESADEYLVLVQNTVQFDVRETWRQRTALALHAGCHLYNKTVRSDMRTVHLDNVDYPGNVFAIRGWPNNYMGFELAQKLGGQWEAAAGLTRLSLLYDRTDFIYGAQLEWKPLPAWTSRFGYNLRRRGVETQQAFALGLTYLW
ncbi:MAG: hypothetical protein NTY77_18190 [Elusimicrobia bacterium]|nr:hypothetical protein [Elusimicrobiota bacterium]